MCAVEAAYPGSRQTLVGFASSQEKVDGFADDSIATNGEEKLRKLDTCFNAELAG